jgi:AcrR family transcriptional regulator
MDHSSAPSAGRPRSEEAHQAILDATLALLVEVGFSGLTVEGVAARAGVGKATIYRRWPSKLPLVVEAFRQLPALEEVARQPRRRPDATLRNTPALQPDAARRCC